MRELDFSLSEAAQSQPDSEKYNTAPMQTAMQS